MMTEKHLKIIVGALLVMCVIMAFVSSAYAQNETPPLPTPAPTMPIETPMPYPTPQPIPDFEYEFYLPAVFQDGYEVSWWISHPYRIHWPLFQWVTLYEEPVIQETWWVAGCKDESECPRTYLHVFEYDGELWWGNTTGLTH